MKMDKEVREAMISLYHCLCTLISDETCEDFEHTSYLGMQDILVIGTDFNRALDCLKKYKSLYDELLDGLKEVE